MDRCGCPIAKHVWQAGGSWNPPTAGAAGVPTQEDKGCWQGVSQHLSWWLNCAGVDGPGLGQGLPLWQPQGHPFASQPRATGGPAVAAGEAASDKQVPPGTAPPQPGPARPLLTCLRPSDMVWVLGLRSEMFSTTTQFVTMRVATVITNIRYLPVGGGRGEEQAGFPPGTHCPPSSPHSRPTVSPCARLLRRTHLPMRGMPSEVSGTFWAIRKRKTVWASSTEMLTVHF